VAVVLTPVQTKQIRINIHKRNNTKTQYKQYKTQPIHVHILPKLTHITKPTHTHTHTVQNKLQQPQYTLESQYKGSTMFAKSRS
jgi:hypothetical protein